MRVRLSWAGLAAAGALLLTPSLVPSAAAAGCPALPVSPASLIIGSTDSTAGGAPLPVGTVVTAVSLQGQIVGCTVVGSGTGLASQPGTFRLVVYGNDGTSDTAGYLNQGDPFNFALNGTLAPASSVGIHSGTAAPAPNTLLFNGANPSTTADVGIHAASLSGTGTGAPPPPTATPLPAPAPNPPASSPPSAGQPSAPVQSQPEPTVTAPHIVVPSPSQPTEPIGPVMPNTSGPASAPLSTNGMPASLPLGPDAAISVAIDPSTAGKLPASLTVGVDPAPVPPNQAAAGSLGGGNVVPVDHPIQLSLTGPNGPIAPGSGGVAELRLPVLVEGSQYGGVFAWLQAIYDPSGNFQGYIRPDAQFDAATDTVLLRVPVEQLGQTLFLPSVIVPAYVQNFSAGTHIYSGPFADAQDFGVAGPQFTTFSVVAPQVAGRIYVYNPNTGNYGWIDAAGVGPVAPPA